MWHERPADQARPTVQQWDRRLWHLWQRKSLNLLFPSICDSWFDRTRFKLLRLPNRNQHYRNVRRFIWHSERHHSLRCRRLCLDKPAQELQLQRHMGYSQRLEQPVLHIHPQLRWARIGCLRGYHRVGAERNIHRGRRRRVSEAPTNLGSSNHIQVHHIQWEGCHVYALARPLRLVRV